MRRFASWTRAADQLWCGGGSLRRLPPQRDSDGGLLRNHASGYKIPMAPPSLTRRWRWQCNAEGDGTTRRASPPLCGDIMMLVNGTSSRQWAAFIAIPSSPSSPFCSSPMLAYDADVPIILDEFQPTVLSCLF